jgi:FMN phosphatase YigB (HAD superfamily)
MPSPPLRAVVFDWGHTLLDFAVAEEAMHDCYEQVLAMVVAEAAEEFPRDVTLVRDISRSVGAEITRSYDDRELEELDLVRLFAEAYHAHGHPLDPSLVRRVVEMEHRALTSSLVMSASNLDVLRTLKEWGLRLGIVSNITFLPELVQADIDRLGIGQYIDAPVYSSAFGRRKPHPAIFRHVVDQLGVRPEETLFVGDRLNDDIAGAQPVGMRTVLTREYRQEDPEPGGDAPDHVIQALPELLPHVRAQLDEAPIAESASPSYDR